MERFLTIEQASRATIVAFEADIPIAWWGAPGIGKSSAIAQLTDLLNDDYAVYDMRLSDKEPSDVGGIPFPGEEAILDEKGNVVLDPESKAPRMRRVLEFLVMKLLPFDSHTKAIVLLDEFDRADLSVQNAALQLVLDRKVNGHKLSPNARIVLAGNAMSDIGTSPLSAAAANRMCHLYIDVASAESLKGWTEWAENNGVSPLMQGFANYQLPVFAGGDPKAKKVEEMAIPTPRSFVYADRLLSAAAEMPFDTDDIVPALVAGCVGKQAASSFLGYRDIYSKLPTMEQIVKNPEGVPINKNPGVLYAHKKQLALWAAEKPEFADSIARYTIRWEEEPAADMFRILREVQPEVVKSAAYQQWEQRRNAPTAGAEPVNQIPANATYRAFCAKCKTKNIIVSPILNQPRNGKDSITGHCGVCGEAVVTFDVVPEMKMEPAPKTSAPTIGGGTILTQAATKLLAQKMGAEYSGTKTGANGQTYYNCIRVLSSGGSNKYTLSQNRHADWECSCRGFSTYKHCKHIRALKTAVVQIAK